MTVDNTANDDCPPEFVQKSYIKAFCCKDDCKTKCKKNWPAIWQRKPSALMPLDGLRAIAIIWIIYLHSLSISFGLTCFSAANETAWYVVVGRNGEIGVDMFFVLSGFLISFILLRETKKYDGQVDVFNFYRGRFLRLWPVLALYSLFYFCTTITNTKEEDQMTQLYNTFAPLVFLNNMVGGMQHTWSVAVEFQFYIISPFIVMYMARSERPYLAPLVLFIIATVLMFGITYGVCPDILDGKFNEVMAKCAEPLWFQTYQKTYTRMAPYGFGMYAAFVHDQDKDHSLINKPGVLCLEWISFIVVIFMTIFGAELQPLGSKDLYSGYVTYIYMCLSRQVFGAALSFLVAVMLSPKPEDPIEGFRPSKWLRAILSLDFWVPIATISYSLYIVHGPLAAHTFSAFAWFNEGAQNIEKGRLEACPLGIWTSVFRYIVYTVTFMIPSVLIAKCCFIYVEKPGIDGRVVYKNKFELKKMADARIAWLEKNQSN